MACGAWASRRKVDEHTLFSIGSTTKAFTSAVLAMLVDEGKLTWDTKVSDVLPGFKMYDPYVRSEMTVRDLRRPSQRPRARRGRSVVLSAEHASRATRSCTSCVTSSR